MSVLNQSEQLKVSDYVSKIARIETKTKKAVQKQNRKQIQPAYESMIITIWLYQPYYDDYSVYDTTKKQTKQKWTAFNQLSETSEQSNKHLLILISAGRLYAWCGKIMRNYPLDSR